MLSKLFTAHYVLFIKLVLVGLVSPEPSFKRFRWKDYINFATNQLSDSSKWQLCTPYPQKNSPHIRLSLCHDCFLHVSLVAPCTDPLLATQPPDAALLIMSLFLHWQLKSPLILFSKSCKLFPSLKFIWKKKAARYIFHPVFKIDAKTCECVVRYVSLKEVMKRLHTSRKCDTARGWAFSRANIRKHSWQLRLL